jgi:capsular polysaccharide transport system permease protein
MSSSLPPLPAPAGRHRRSAWEIQRGVLFALLLREMKTRVGGQWVGAVWTLIEPLMHVAMMMVIFTSIRGANPMFGPDFPVFLATGLIPFFLFQNLGARLMDGIDANRGLYAYRQVKPLDTLMSRALVEGIMNALVYLVTLGVLGFLGHQVLPRDPLEALGVHLVLFILGFGFGTFSAAMSHERPRLRSFIRMTMLPLYFASGVLFPVHYAPQELQHWLLLNPLLHLIELSRQAFMPGYELLQGVNMRYPLLFTLALGALAMLTYQANRLRLVTST